MKHIFLDTSFFEENNFFKGKLGRLYQYVKDGYIKLYTNEIVIKEVKSRISKKMAVAKSSCTKLFNSPDSYILGNTSHSDTVRKLKDKHQINSAVFERTMLGNAKLSPVMREIHPNIFNAFKDDYVLEFLGLPEAHNEGELHKGLVNKMKSFILELGKDFLFVGDEYRVQVGNSDFYIDLVFYHRGLQCLIAFELKADKFKPEHLGQLNFYLEALDRDIRKSNENPSIGILLCKDKDSEVVEYTLSRSLSPTMVSEYKTQLPDKRLLQNKLKELFD